MNDYTTERVERLVRSYGIEPDEALSVIFRGHRLEDLPVKVVLILAGAFVVRVIDDLDDELPPRL